MSDIFTWITYSWIIGLMFLYTIILAENKSNKLFDYCESDRFTPSCAPDHVILIRQAEYGRMTGSHCIDNAHGCVRDVLPLLDERCSGRPHCSVVVANLVPDELQPCNRDYRSFLRARYDCIPVASSTNSHCGSQESMTLYNKTGYLSSHVTNQSGTGNIECPWLIRVGEGQRLNLTLLDFSMNAQSANGQCNVYATIKERLTRYSSTVCGNDRERVRHIFLSESNHIEVRIMPRSKDSRQFIIKYEAIGCATPPRPLHGYVKRTGSTALVGCNYTEESWTLKCTGNTWDSDPGNCSRGVLSSSLQGGSGIDLGSINMKAALFLIVSIAMPVSIIILIIGLVCIYKRRREHLRTVQSQLQHGSVLYSPYGPKYSAAYAEGAMGKHPQESGPYSDIPPNHQGMDIGSQPGGNFAPMENDYFQTWQRQQQQQNSSDTYRYERAAKEHIYESPQFKRKNEIVINTERSSSSPYGAQNQVGEESGTLGYYFEIDPNTNNPLSNNGPKLNITT